jgi:alpha-beta hydrolase superfamily lysophospholipase
LGATEWHDADAAVTYAIQHGASGVVLYGYSLGGALALTEARNRAPVRAVVLDSPLLEWRATIRYAAHRRGIPRLLADLTMKVLAWRDDINYTQLDQLAQARTLHTPVLLFQGTADTIVPPALAARFARERADLVTYAPVAGADHASAIDTDPVTHRRALDQFLTAWP